VHACEMHACEMSIGRKYRYPNPYFRQKYRYLSPYFVRAKIFLTISLACCERALVYLIIGQ
jgi:hypothetical protein